MAIEKFPVSRHETLYQAWPDIAETATGRLVCVFSQCTHHGDRGYARFVAVVSDDRGRTWSEPQPITEDSPTGHWNCPRVTRLADGRLVVSGDHVVGRERNEPGNLTNWLWYSTDDGQTWDGPHATGVYGIVPDKLLELPSGRWLLGAHMAPDDGSKLVQRVWWSDDQGGTWEGPAVVGQSPDLDLCEVSIVPQPSGELVAFMRENSGEGWDGYKSFSVDGGETWEGPYRVPLPGCHRPVAGWLQSGLCLITYRFIQGGRGGWGRSTQNFFAAVMTPASVAARDRRQQWARILPIDHDHHRHADLGYSGWVQFDDGEILIVTYLLDDWPRGQIRGYRLTEAEFGQLADD